MTVIACAFCLVLILALIAVHTSPVRRIVANRVAAFLASRHIDVSVGDFRYNLLAGSMTVRDVRVHPTEWRHAHALVTIGRAHVDISLPELFRGRYVVQTGQLEDVDFSYFVDGNGQDASSSTEERDSVTTSIDYFVSSFSIAKARVRYKNAAQQIDARLPITSIEVNGNALTGRHEVSFDATEGELSVRGLPIAIDRLDGHVDVGRDDLAIERIGIDSNGSHVEAKGTIAPFAAPVITADLSASPLQYRDLRDVQLDAMLAVDLPAQSANISAFQLRAPWGVMDAKGRVAFDGSGQSIISADVRRLDAATLMRSLWLPYTVATEIDATLQAEWPGLDYLKAMASADVDLRPPASGASKSAVPVTGRLAGHRVNGRIDAQLVQVVVPGAEVNGRIEVTSDRQLQGTVTARSGDVGQLLSSVESLTGRPAGSSLRVPVGGSAKIDAHLAGSVDAPTATTTVTLPALAVGAAEGIALNAEAMYAARTITISHGEVVWRNTRARVDGRIGLGLDAPIDLSLSADDLSVPSLLRAMNQPHVPASGTLSAAGAVRGTMTRPHAVITTTGSNLVAYGEDLGSLSGTIRLEDNVLTSDLTIDKPQPDRPGRVSAKGTYDIHQQTYTFDLQSSGLQLLGVALPDGQRLRADVPRLSARGSGSVASPEGTIDLDVSAIEIARPDETVLAKGGLTSASHFGGVSLNGVAKDGEATITATAEHLEVAARATIGLSKPWPSTITLQAVDTDLTALPLQALIPGGRNALAGLDGQLRATLDASGSLSEPAQGIATVTMEARGTWNGRPFSITSPSPLHYADERLTIGTLRIEGLDSSLTVSGNLPIADYMAPGELVVDLRGTLATLTQYAPTGTNISGDGAVALTGSLRGTLTRIEPDLALSIDDGLVLGPALQPGLSNIALRARVENGAADIEQFSATWGTATLQASGRIPLDAAPTLPAQIVRGGGPTTLRAALSGLDPSSIPGMPAQLGGRISAEAELSATSADPRALDGRLSFNELDVSFGGLTLAQRQPTSLAIASGAVVVDEFELSGSAGTIRARGSVELHDERSVDVDVNGTLNVAALSIFTNRLRTNGDSTIKLLARGPLTSPELTGTVDVMDATVVSTEPNIAIEDLNARVEFAGRRMSLTQLAADVNGGTVSASGAITLGEGFVRDVDLEISAEDVAYDAPLDLRSLSNATIQVTRSGDNAILVKGKITIEEAGLTDDVNLDVGLLARIAARRDPGVVKEERNPLLERVRFDINVATAAPVLVDNNLARAEIEADLRIVGTPDEPGLLGTLTMLEGSEVLLNERRYQAERGIITFADERRIVPSFDFRLNTTTSGHDISIVITGTPGSTETTLTSVPSRPEPDILAMLVTGRTLDEVRGEELDVARDQMLSLMAGRVGSTLGRGLQEATGFSEVRIEPTLIANEADPSARLTVGQNLTSNLRIVYSMNLADSNDQIWIVEYDLTRRFRARGIWQDDGSYRFDFRRDLRIGGPPDASSTERVRSQITGISVTVDRGSEAAVRNTLGVKAGDVYDFFAIRTGIQRVEESLIEQGYLQSRVRLQRETTNREVQLNVHVVTGPRVDIVTMGVTPPRRVEEALRHEWQRGVFDKQRADQGAETLREWLMDDNYLQAQIEYDIEDVTEDERRVVFHVQPGMRSRRIVLAFEGASAGHAHELNRIIETQRLERQLFTDPRPVTETLQRYYRVRGYLSAQIDEPQLQFEGDAARLVLPVEEGPVFTVGSIAISGNTVFRTDELVPRLPLVAGHTFEPAFVENSIVTIRDLYWSKGYNDVRVDYALTTDLTDHAAQVAFTIAEGPQSILAGVSITGNERVSDRLVEAQIQLSPGEPLDLSSLARSRRQLYGTGGFSVVDITRRESDDADVDREKNVHLDVAVKEVAPFQLRYGASYDTERSVGVILDLAKHNALGGAREIGIQSRYDSQLRDVRFYVNQPELTQRHETTLTMYFREELNPPTELTDPFDTSRKGIALQQHRRLRQRYVLTYGYKYERAQTLTPTPIGIVEESIGVSPLTSTLTRETRDVVFDASKGAFLSQALSFSPSWLGSEQPFVKYFGQYFRYFPLEPQRQQTPMTAVIRPRFVFASGVRLGLAWGLDGDVPRTERFFAGGSATLRGFEQNTVGPITPERFALGGEALLVLNNEVRMPLIGVVDGVVFTDIGNVFGKVSDFSFTNLRQSAGIGLRIRTPWLLLRADYGVVLDPRPGEQRGQFYFSVGQAF